MTYDNDTNTRYVMPLFTESPYPQELYLVDKDRIPFNKYILYVKKVELINEGMGLRTTLYILNKGNYYGRKLSAVCWDDKQLQKDTVIIAWLCSSEIYDDITINYTEDGEMDIKTKTFYEVFSIQERRIANVS